MDKPKKPIARERKAVRPTRIVGVPFTLDEVVYLQIRRNGKLITIQEDDEEDSPAVKGFAQ